MKKHEMTVTPEVFRAIWNRQMQFIIAERNELHSVGDMVVVLEWSEERDEWTGAGTCMRVTCIVGDLNYVKAPYVILGITTWDDYEEVSRDVQETKI